MFEFMDVLIDFVALMYHRELFINVSLANVALSLQQLAFEMIPGDFNLIVQQWFEEMYCRSLHAQLIQIHMDF